MYCLLRALRHLAGAACAEQGHTYRCSMLLCATLLFGWRPCSLRNLLLRALASRSKLPQTVDLQLAHRWFADLETVRQRLDLSVTSCFLDVMYKRSCFLTLASSSCG